MTESFLPQINGVTNTVCHVLDRLIETGHEPLLVAPGPGPTDYHGVRIVRVRSMPLPGYKTFNLGLPGSSVERELARFQPDVVHLASPIVLGATGLRAARRLGVPTVAVYQTDIAAFARQYGISAEAVVTRWVGRLHRRADRTLVPSRSSYAKLAGLGVTNIHLWRRGVSLDLFDPAHRSEELRRRWLHLPATAHGAAAPVVVGYVGRLAHEKQVRRLTEIAALPNIHLVVIGDGPERSWLERHLREATFTGLLHGQELARAFACLDVFVHTGESETFCQTVQEAQASGVPVVAPASGGPLDLITHQGTGMLYATGHRSALAGTVSSLAADPRLRHDLARRALDQVAGRTWSRVVDDLVNRHYEPVSRTAVLERLAA